MDDISIIFDLSDVLIRGIIGIERILGPRFEEPELDTIIKLSREGCAG